ncbi:MAG: hypothetical protein Kow0077_19380 [Anaerolineae bacterium]
MSTVVQTFFVREIVRLRHSIALLERGLSAYPPGDPRADGQRALLASEQKSRELLLDLAENATDLVALQLALRVQYGLAVRDHERARNQAGDGEALRDDHWWETLGKMEYLGYLMRQLDHVVNALTPEERRSELNRAVAAKDVKAAAERAQLLGAIARADGSADTKRYLVRHDPQTPSDAQS